MQLLVVCFVIIQNGHELKIGATVVYGFPSFGLSLLVVADYVF